MNHEDRTPDELRASWFPRFLNAVESGRAAHRYTGAPPRVELELLYWGDLFAPPFAPPVTDTIPLQGLGDYLAEKYYALVRQIILSIDRQTKYDPQAHPRSYWARIINGMIVQTAMYMANAPIPRVTAGARTNVYDEIQRRFRKFLDWGPQVVVGHSLGSVIAYEGLCESRRQVPSLLTVGSPIGVPELIYDKLRPRGTKPRSAPNVRDWVNVSNLADPMVVPVPKIAELFREPVRDVLFQSGNPVTLKRNHTFVGYLNAPEVHAVIAEAIEAARHAP